MNGRLPSSTRDTAQTARLRIASWATPPAFLLLAIVIWCFAFGVLVYLRQARFASPDFDSGIFDQAIWLLARGHSFITVRGLDVFGQHASVAYFLLAPFSWLGAGPNFLNVLQVLSLGLGAIAVFHIASFHLRDSWLALALAVAFLLHPSIQWFAQELFHPEVIAITPLLFAYLAALHRRWRWFAVLAIFAMAWKEDVALAVGALGVVLLVRKEWRAGALTLGGALLWFFLATRLVLHEGDGIFYARAFYGDFGSSGAEIAQSIVTHPARVAARLQNADALGYVSDLTGPYGFASLLAPLPLIIGAPQALFNLISVQDFTWRTELHYAALPVVAASIAMVEGVARVRRLGLRRFLVGLVLASAWWGTVTSGAAPISRRFDEGMWPLATNARQHALKAAVRIPPRDAVVSASYLLVPHLTHRQGIFSFPNPWIPTNFGQIGDRGPNPEVVQWLVVDRLSVGPNERDLLDRLIGSGTFRVVSARQDIVVAARHATVKSPA